MQRKELTESDVDLVKLMWAKRGELVVLGFNVRQQYLEAEAKIHNRVGEIDTELNTLVKLLREKLNISEDWKLDLAEGAFVNPALGEEPVQTEEG